MARREYRTAGVESGPKSSIVKLWNMEKLPAPPGLATGQTLPQGGSGEQIGRTEEAKAGGKAPDTPTSVGSEMARKYLEPLFVENADDDRRLSVGASQSCGPQEHSVVGARCRYGRGVRPRGQPYRGSPYEDLSRMKGNFHVRF